MARTWIIVAAVNGGVSVAAGAFGAHGLKGRLDAEMLAIFETAARYQMYHALALLATAIIADRLGPRAAAAACWSFLAGIIVFSGSLYVLALSGVRGWGAVTPFGGAAFLIGWGAITVGAMTRKVRPAQRDSAT